MPVSPTILSSISDILQWIEKYSFNSWIFWTGVTWSRTVTCQPHHLVKCGSRKACSKSSNKETSSRHHETTDYRRQVRSHHLICVKNDIKPLAKPLYLTSTGYNDVGVRCWRQKLLFSLISNASYNQFFRQPILVIYVVDETEFNENNALKKLARKKRSLIPMPEET